MFALTEQVFDCHLFDVMSHSLTYNSIKKNFKKKSTLKTFFCYCSFSIKLKKKEKKMTERIVCWKCRSVYTFHGNQPTNGVLITGIAKTEGTFCSLRQCT